MIICTFLEIGTDKNHVHFLVQRILDYAPTKIVKIIKSITASQIFAECPQVKKQLWGGQFWSDRYFIISVGKNQNEKVIKLFLTICKMFLRNRLLLSFFLLTL